MLNTKKGPAVRAMRAQADKIEYKNLQEDNYYQLLNNILWYYILQENKCLLH